MTSERPIKDALRRLARKVGARRIRSTLATPLSGARGNAALVPGQATLNFRHRIAKPRKPAVIVLIAGRSPDELVSRFSNRFPEAQIHAFNVPRDVSVDGLVRHVIMHRTPDVIIDATTSTDDKLECFRRLFLLLEPKGRYVIEGVDVDRIEADASSRHAAIWKYLLRLLMWQSYPDIQARSSVPRDDIERAGAIGSIEKWAGAVLIRKTGHHSVVLADSDVSEALNHRVGPQWGQVLDERPGQQLDSRAQSSSNSPERGTPLRGGPFAVPTLFLRQYNDVICEPQRAVTRGGALLPISFPTPSGDVVPAPEATGEPPLAGTYYHLGSGSPESLDVLATDGIGRLWGWDVAKQAHPDLKLLLSRESGDVDHHRQRIFLGALGIADADTVRVDGTVSLESLIGASPLFSRGEYVHPDIKAPWLRLRDALVQPGRRTPARVFAVPADGSGGCRNSDEVTSWFRQHGFEVVNLGELDVREQATLFARAEVIAAYGGQQGRSNWVFTHELSQRIIITSDAYDAGDEYLIASVLGGSYHHVWCSPESADGASPRGDDGQQPSFVFDVQREGPPLRTWLDSL